MIRKKSKTVLLAVILACNLTACGVALENRSFPLSMGVDLRTVHTRSITAFPTCPG